MDTQPMLGFEDTIASIVNDAAEAVSRRPGESAQRRDARARAAVGAIMAFRPADPAEAMLASHCVMFHEMTVAGVNRALGDDDAPSRTATAALDKAFCANFTRLKQRQTKPETTPPEHRTEPEIADRISRHLSKIEPNAAECTQTESDIPGEAWPTAGLNRQARRLLDRQLRKRAPGVPRPGVTADRNEATATTSAISAD